MKNVKGRVSAILALLIAMSCGTKDQTVSTSIKELDAFLSELNENEQFNGGILVAKGGEVLLSEVYGFADFEAGKQLNKNTLFQTASISKTFTAAAIFQLVEKNQLSLEDSLTSFFPQLPYSSVQIKHLLGHTSGLYPYNPLFQQHWDHEKIAVNDDVIAMFEEHQPETFFTPGEEFSYCNVGYVFLASIVEQVSGMSFREYLSKNIFKELGMNDTRIYTLLDDPEGNFAQEHVLDPFSGKHINPINTGYHSYVHYLNGKVGDDKVASTLEDMLLWSKALFQEEFLGEENTTIAFTNSNHHIPLEKRHSKFDYGMGFQLDSTEYGLMIYHNGGEPGLKTRFHYYTDLDLTIVLYVNAYVNYTRDVEEGIISILNNKPYKLPKKSIADEVAKQADKSLVALDKVVELMKSDTANYYLSENEINDLAGIYWSQEQYDVGMEFLKLNYKHFPASVGAVYTLGEGYMETGRMDEAIPYFKEARDLMLQRPVEKQRPRFIEAMDRLIKENS